MAYNKTEWRNGETALSANNLNKMEQGIEDAHKMANMPVGSIYMSLEFTDPNEWASGIWTRLKDVLLLAKGDTSKSLFALTADSDISGDTREVYVWYRSE